MINRIRISHVRVPSHATNDALPNEQRVDLNACTSRPASTLPPATVTTSAPQAAHAYAELKHMIQQHRLLEKQPLYYTCKMALLLGSFVLGILFLILVRPLWLQLLNAVYLALVTTQLGLIGHDAGHRQIFRKTWKNDLVGLLAGNLLIGMSNGWWMDKHNRHHSHPNQHGLDPDISVPILSLDGEDLFEKGKLQQFMIKHQAIFFFPVLSLLPLLRDFYASVVSRDPPALASGQCSTTCSTQSRISAFHTARASAIVLGLALLHVERCQGDNG